MTDCDWTGTYGDYWHCLVVVTFGDCLLVMRARGAVRAEEGWRGGGDFFFSRVDFLC